MSASSAGALSFLAEIAGEANVIRDSAQLAAYRVDGLSPAAAVRPGSPEEVAEIVKLPARERLAIVASGARTKLGIGGQPQRYDIALDMTRMDRIVSYDPGDLTLSVEAGTPLRKIAIALAEHRQFLPLAVPFMDRATAGGTFASGVDSPLRQFYGTARDFTLGVEFVTGEGITEKSGGRVVKNVSGYDIHKLMIGSLGTLAVITRINFRTFPMPRGTRTFIATFRGAEAACAFRHAMAKSALRPQSIEILGAGGDGVRLLGERTGLPFEGDRWSVVVSCAGNEQVLERFRQELEALARTAAGSSLKSFDEVSGEARNKINACVVEFPALILEHAPSAAIFKITTLPTEMTELARAVQSIQAPWVLVMRGLGVAYLALLPAASLEKECQSILGRAGTPPWRHVTLPWCPKAMKNGIDVWGLRSANLALIKKLKDVFDPSGILSPGRFMGAI